MSTSAANNNAISAVENEKIQINNSASQIIRDPKLVKNRIFVRNLPACTREDLESICLPYAPVLASHVQKNFGFVQFESEEIANKVASALNKSTFKGNIITARNASAKPIPPTYKTGSGNGNADEISNSGYNDCEIIVVNRTNTKYAEYIEGRLKRIGLRVDVLFPNEDVAIGMVLANISSRGCLYAVLVNTQHEERRSITVNVLYGAAAEHRNMPLEDAIKLIGDDFRIKMQRDGKPLPQPVPIISASAGGNVIAPPLFERHPESIQILLNVLADNMPLTVLQYDRIIKYLQERRTLQLKTELGDAALDDKQPDPEIELQKKILNILNKPSVAEIDYELMYPDLQAVKADARLMSLLMDERVQTTLESLFNSELLATVGEYLK